MITRDITWTRAVQDACKAVGNHLRLFEGDHGAVFLASGTRLPFELVIPNLLGECLTEPLADLQFPAAPRLEVTPDGLADEAAALLGQMGWAGLLYPTALRVSYAGWADWKLVWNAAEGRPELVLWGARPGEFAVYDPDGRGVAYWYEVVVPGGRVPRAYKVRELHRVDEAGTTVTNAAFKLQAGNVSSTPSAWSEVAPAWGDGPPPAEEARFDGLTLPPGHRVENVRGVSDYTRSRKNLQWRLILLESARNFSVALTTVPQLVISPEAVNRQTGQIDWEKLIFQYRRPGDGATAVLDLKTAVTSLGDSSTVLENLWDDWNAVNPVSPIFYGKAVGSTASGRSLDISLQGTVHAVERRRGAYPPATRWALAFGAQLQAHYAGVGLVRGHATVYGKCVDVGGAVKPRAKIRLDGGGTVTAYGTEEQIRQLGRLIFDDVRLDGVGVWTVPEWALEEMEIACVEAHPYVAPAEAFAEMRRTSAAHWRGVDPRAFVKELRGG